MGGVWERLLQSVKRCLKLVLQQPTTDEVLHTLMVEVEAVVNSRPLVYTGDAEIPEALTPSHFLLGRGSPNLPPCIFKNEVEVSHQRRWKQTQMLAAHFWNKWSREYVPTLITRTKWLRKRPNLAVNDVVLVVDEDLPRRHWKLGRVVKIFVGKDGNVRSAEVKTRKGNYVRPVSKLCVLEKSKD
ncbi:uncharacterized protein LOC141904341 [Tubulanus polymorphus]|uniref:uncharacterized protein LOC141904341 n=1 Tax=Tubulanus polymorphus TaxID=672921 RepID=UPI003DA51048